MSLLFRCPATGRFFAVEDEAHLPEGQVFERVLRKKAPAPKRPTLRLIKGSISKMAQYRGTAWGEANA